MYYKIINKNSDLYKKLHELRTKELELEKNNNNLVKEIVGDDWNEFVGHVGQQNFMRCTRYKAFRFRHPENLPPKTWVLDKEFGKDGAYIPNNRTKAGREIREKLDNMPHSSIIRVFEILECEMSGRFAYPFVEICNGGEIVIYMSDRYDLESKFNEVIEITKREADKLLTNKM
ncbi:MAG: hypothetical protein K6F72_00225 [Bacteroidales bacterium]|nr:hypothetical protein [Bacteroidales bacterium]